MTSAATQSLEPTPAAATQDQASLYQRDESFWQHLTKEVPTYEITAFAPRRTKYCVLIPVINEGARIQNLLRRMHEQGIPAQSDVILVDGGTTDGSLAADFLQSVSVRTLLLKTGPGKLSAQLRCGYAYAMEEGYAGVVTIDGNDKDDPDPIPVFIEHLEAGVDFIQASRYQPGGVEENTPLVRKLAIRLLHAPALAMASGFPWKDTTQGFRGYSRSMLIDPRIDLYRDCFKVYELLAYLTCRAPQLGFRCMEAPTVRRYPAEGKIPTKISAFSGNLDLLKTLGYTICGAYNVPGSEAATQQPPWWRQQPRLVAFLLLTLLTALLFTAANVALKGFIQDLNRVTDSVVTHTLDYKAANGVFAEGGSPRMSDNPTGTYDSQIVGLSFVLTPFYPDTEAGRTSAMNAVRLLFIALTVLLIAFMATEALASFDPFAAALTPFAMVPTVLLAGSLYWVFWYNLAAALLGWTLAKRTPANRTWLVGIAVAFAVVLGRSLMNYEFLSAILMAYAAGRVYHWAYQGAPWKSLIRDLALTAAAGVVALLVAVALHQVMLKSAYGADYHLGLWWEKVRFRIDGQSTTQTQAALSPITGLIAYPAFLAVARQAAHALLLPWLLLWALSLAFIVTSTMRGETRPRLLHDKTVRGLAFATTFALAAGFSWPLLMSSHAGNHTHQTTMVFYLAFVPLTTWLFASLCRTELWPYLATPRT